MELRDEQNHLARSNSPRPSNEERESFSPRLIQSDDTFLTPKTEKYVLRKSPIERKHTLQLKGLPKSTSPSPKQNVKRSPKLRPTNILPELSQTPSTSTSRYGVYELSTKLTSESQLDFPRYKESWISCPVIPYELDSAQIESIYQKREQIKQKFNPGDDSETEDEDTDDNRSTTSSRMEDDDLTDTSIDLEPSPIVPRRAELVQNYVTTLPTTPMSAFKNINNNNNNNNNCNNNNNNNSGATKLSPRGWRTSDPETGYTEHDKPTTVFQSISSPYSGTSTTSSTATTPPMGRSSPTDLTEQFAKKLVLDHAPEMSPTRPKSNSNSMDYSKPIKIQVPNSTAYTVDTPIPASQPQTLPLTNSNLSRHDDATRTSSPSVSHSQTQALFKKKYYIHNPYHLQQQQTTTNPTNPQSSQNSQNSFISSSSPLSSSPILSITQQPKDRKGLENLINELTVDQLRKLIMEVATEKEMEEYVENKIKNDNKYSVNGSIGETVFQWNEAFQKGIEDVKKLSPNTRMEERIRVYEDLANHANDFIYTATTYGKIIIAEVYLPPEQKTIKPITMEGRGVAGGEKYLQRGIYFKFAVDSHNIYQEEESVAKVAGHELKSLDQLFCMWMKGIHYPMMILIDYRGYRLIAMSTLPINENTIVYGSSDAGVTIHTDNLAICDKMKAIANKLNLKEHRVGSKFMEKIVSTPVDLEGHYGFDGRYYLIDFSRTFPPTKPDGAHSSYLFKLMRPEFVKKYPRPLCSDAFSNFIKNHNPEVHNQEVSLATDYLKSTLVPEFAEILSTIPANFRTHYPLIQCLHSYGINLRYAGLVRSHLRPEQSYWRFVFLLEMVTRTIKQQIRSELRESMRKLKHSGEEPYKKLIIERLNLIFGDVPASDSYWMGELKELLMVKFEGCLSDEEQSPKYHLKQVFAEAVSGLIDGRCLLFRNLSAVLGLQWQPSTLQAFCENPKVFNFAEPLDEADLDLSPTVKTMNIAQHSEGFVVKLKASKRTGEESVRLYRLAIQKFEQALESSPGNKVTLRNLADCYTCIDEYALAEYYYQEAIRSSPSDTNTLFKYGCFLERYGKFDLAEETYLQALEVYPYHSNALTVYADFLACCRRNYKEAENFYKMAIRADKNNAYGRNNYACFLSCIRKYYNLAEEQFKKCIEIDSGKPLHLQNYAMFVENIRKNSVEAQKLHELGEALERKQLLRSFSVSSSELVPNKSNSLTKTQKRNLRRKKLKQKIKSSSGSVGWSPSEGKEEDDTSSEEEAPSSPELGRKGRSRRSRSKTKLDLLV